MIIGSSKKHVLVCESNREIRIKEIKYGPLIFIHLGTILQKY